VVPDDDDDGNSAAAAAATQQSTDSCKQRPSSSCANGRLSPAMHGVRTSFIDDDDAGPIAWPPRHGCSNRNSRRGTS